MTQKQALKVCAYIRTEHKASGIQEGLFNIMSGYVNLDFTRFDTKCHRDI